MNTRKPWEVRNGKIYTKRLEINISHHCNLSCRGCSHLSPFLPKFFESPQDIYRDLSLLSKNFRTNCISLIGGEPLLNPDLLEIISVVRKSRVTDRIRIVTNGILLKKMKAQFWREVDEVIVSLYPSHPMQVKHLKVFQGVSRKYSTYLELSYQDYFSEFFSDLGTSDDALIKKIYLTCTAPREACCHTLFQGRYYKCPNAVFIPFIYDNQFNFNTNYNSVKVTEDTSFVRELDAYLSSELPLQTCKYCLGSVGKRFTHEQGSRRKVFGNKISEELIDYKRLEQLVGNKGLPVPAWFRKKMWSYLNILIAILPPSIRLSPELRRIVSRISDISRTYVK